MNHKDGQKEQRKITGYSLRVKLSTDVITGYLFSFNYIILHIKSDSFSSFKMRFWKITA